jgi:hypothetical protein
LNQLSQTKKKRKEKDVEEDYTGLDMKKRINKKQYRNKIEAKLELLIAT